MVDCPSDFGNNCVRRLSFQVANVLKDRAASILRFLAFPSTFARDFLPKRIGHLCVLVIIGGFLHVPPVVVNFVFKPHPLVTLVITAKLVTQGQGYRGSKQAWNWGKPNKNSI